MTRVVTLAPDFGWHSLRPDALGAGPIERCARVPTRSVPVTSEGADARDDDALIAAVARGDAGAYRTLSARHLAPVLRFATRFLGNLSDAEDVTQETFLRLWQNAARYEPRGHKATTWIYRIAHNLCMDRLRQRHPLTDATGIERVPTSDHPSDTATRKELRTRIEHALAQLPERQRAAIVLVHHEGLTGDEAAAVLECGPEALESLLSRGRRTLREALADTRDGSGGEAK